MKTKTQIDYFDKIIKSLKELKKDHPNHGIARHLDIAFCDESFSYMSDKEFSDILDKYISELELNIFNDEDLEKVIEDTEGMFKVKPEDEEDVWEDDIEF